MLFRSFREFNPSRNRFLRTIHDKTVSLQNELKEIILRKERQGVMTYAFKEIANLLAALLKKVYTKCHLYGSLREDKPYLMEDPIYKKFVDTYLNDYLPKA